MPTDRRPPPAPPSLTLEETDRRRLERRGITEEQLHRQVALLRQGANRTPLLRPCGCGDGIVTLAADEETVLVDSWRRAAREGRLEKLVPASGAASRMFARLRARAGDEPPGSRERLEREAAGGDEDAAAVVRLLDELPRLALTDRLAELLTARGIDLGRSIRDGAYVPLLDALLGADGLGYGTAPKALVAFHRYPWGARTALEEHLAESARYLAETGGRCRLHFTVAPTDEPAFRAALATVLEPPETLPAADYRVGFSYQDPATDTVAIDAAGRLFRDTDGRILLRPAGHGSLLGNLEALGGDLVLVGNIDNVVPEDRQEVVVRWKRLLVGHTVRLEEELARLRRRLGEAGDNRALGAEVATGLGRLLALEPPAGAGDRVAVWARSRLQRPLRVCGVVANAGEPGGGPFWVRDADGGASGQIIEPPEVDREDPDQRRIWEASTHFNPVNMVLSLRDPEGVPYRLEPFVDERRSLVTTRHHHGHELRVLERPGLWNGAMAGWNTAFVELPAATFNPVKTVFDLLRPEHQPAAS